MRQINKFLLTIILICVLFVSCNASILMTNGEVVKPNTSISRDELTNVKFSKASPKAVSATKSYYTDKIVVRWNPVEGADFYTIEKAEHSEPIVGANSEWKEIMETPSVTYFTDSSKLETGVYYSYRITAHTIYGESGEVSEVATGTVLSSPINISVAKGESETGIAIEWGQMPYVESYELYKSTQSSITGLESEYVATIQATNSSESLGYFYQIDESKEKGVELYFAIKGVGPTGEKAQISLPRSGYTLVPGAPARPSISVTKGDSTEQITIRISKGDDDTKYIIKRSFPGSSETVIFSNEFEGSTLESDDTGYYYVDSDVKKNVEYTYSVIAYNDIGLSRASTSTGYLLSPVKKVNLIPITSGNKGYEFSFTEPIGVGDEERLSKYVYHVVAYFKNGNEEEYTRNEGEANTEFFPIEENITPESEGNEISYVTVTVYNGELSSEEAKTVIIKPLPLPVYSIEATKNDNPLSDDTPNSNGVYPVHIKWTSDFDGERTLIRIDSNGIKRSFPITSGTSFTDTTCDVLVTYDYYIDTSDAFGRTLGEIKHTGESYGSITEEKLVEVFESVCLKPWEKQAYVPADYKQYWKKCKIATLVGYGNASDLNTQMKALDSASDGDHFRGGKISYSAKMEGVGGAIYFGYENFGENKNLSLIGNYEMHVNASGDGSASSAGLTLSGMYPSVIKLDKVSVSKKAFSGSYIVEYNGHSGVEVAVK